MATHNSFKIISVTGAHSGVGKTTLCSILLKNLEGFGAIKFTKTPLYTSVVDDHETILQGNKDTAIMSDAGAEKVVWVKSDSSDLGSALNIALGKMSGLKGVVVEGNSPADFLNPHLILFVIAQDGQIKPTAVEVSENADIIIINTVKHKDAIPFSVPQAKKKRETFWINLITGEGEIDKLIAHVKKYIT